MTHRVRSCLIALTVLWCPSAAAAQSPGATFADIAKLPAGETLIVTETMGGRFKGRLTAVDEHTFSVMCHGRVWTFARSDVKEVRLTDGLANGALIGAGIGAGAAMGILAAVAASEDGYVLPSARIAAPLTLAGAGALIGALIDRAHDGGRVLYVTPLVSKDRRGLFFSVRLP